MVKAIEEIIQLPGTSWSQGLGLKQEWDVVSRLRLGVCEGSSRGFREVMGVGSVTNHCRRSLYTTYTVTLHQ